jgi:hypothetical protein
MGGWEGASPSDTLNGLKAVNPVESYAARDEKVLSVRSLVALSQPFSLLLCTFDRNGLLWPSSESDRRVGVGLGVMAQQPSPRVFGDMTEHTHTLKEITLTLNCVCFSNDVC